MLSRRSHDAWARTVVGWLSVAALAVLPACDCGDSSGGAKQDAGQSTAQAQPTSTADATEKLTKRCEQLGQACGQKDKHKDKITTACLEAAKTQGEKGCADQVVAAYDCYEKELCGDDKRIWALDDFRVLTARHGKCVAEREASEKCVAGETK